MNIDVVKKAGISDKPKAMKTNLCKFSGGTYGACSKM